jgi:predicted nucleic acid-binding protein
MIIDVGTQIPAGFAFGVVGAGFGQGEWRPGGSVWQLLKDDLDAAWDKLPNKKRKRNNKSNNLRDASIAEAAFHNRLVLVTCDHILASVAEKHGITVQLL